MFQRVLVPTEGTPRDAEAVDVARHLARRVGASLVLLRVREPLASAEEDLEADRELERQVHELTDEGLDVQHLVEFGWPAAGIAETASAQHVDLIIMAPRHRRRLESMRHPSVTARMFAHAPAPLLIWPEKSPGKAFSNFLNVAGSVVIVPLDGSAVAEEALPFALAFAQEYSRPLLIMRAVPPMMLVGAGSEAYQIQMQAQTQQEREARQYLASVRRRIARDQSVTVQSTVLRGEPEHEVLRIAETHNGSLLVMSTHGRSGITRLFAGSVALAVMRDSPLPLLVVPPHVQRDTGANASEKGQDQAATVP